jgi:hypothetical protein
VHVDDEPEEEWSDDQDTGEGRINVGRSYQQDLSDGSAYDNDYTGGREITNELLFEEDEAAVAVGSGYQDGHEPARIEDHAAEGQLHDAYCDQHHPRTSADWANMTRDWTQEFHRIVRGMDDTGSTHDAKKRMHVAEQLVSASQSICRLLR